VIIYQILLPFSLNLLSNRERFSGRRAGADNDAGQLVWHHFLNNIDGSSILYYPCPAELIFRIAAHTGADEALDVRGSILRPEGGNIVKLPEQGSGLTAGKM
jgi:hypothetical protein